MSFETLLAFLGALMCGSLGIGALHKEPRNFVPRVFALGMLTLALREAFVGLGAQAALWSDGLRWQRLGWVVTTLLPGSWLLFSLSFARMNYQALLGKWKWIVMGAFALPLGMVAVFGQALLTIPDGAGGPPYPGLPLGWAGYMLSIFCLLMAVAVLIHLEGSLRASTGTKRWQMKLVILGVGSIFASYVYTMSQTLLFVTVTPAMQTVDSWAVVVADMLIIVALVRHRLSSAQVALSQITLRNSLTVLLVGIYLLAVGVLTKVIGTFGSSQMLPLGAFFVFVALVGLAIILLSDQWRYQVKHFINRHVYQARHDFRQVWMAFTRRTTAVVEVKDLCAAITRLVSETFAVPSVTIWLVDSEAPGQVRLGGSTVFAEDQSRLPGFTAPDIDALFGYLRDLQRPVDFAAPSDARGAALYQVYAANLRGAYIRYAVPLVAGQEFLGVLTLHERLTGEPFTLEDDNLLTTIAAQAATNLRTLQLAQRLARAQQMAAFQTLSAFFVHDLKNLASKLALTLQTLPVHYDKPAFREDMLRLIADSVAKIHAMCGRLSLLTQKLELHCTETDLNELVRTTLVDLQPSLTVPLITDLHPIPRLTVDPEQLEKVLVNLVLNAHEAAGSRGAIRVVTEGMNGWTVLAVHDNGCGMSREFMEHSLFQPFHTTKRRGLGIGLFQSKMIVEAHQGKIEVESEEGKGSTFRVLLRC